MLGTFVRSQLYSRVLQRPVRLFIAGLCVFCAAGLVLGDFFAHAFVFLFLMSAATVLVLGELS